MLSELYKAGKIRQEALGVLAKTIICIKTGCLATGPEVALGDVKIQLAEAVAIAPQPRPQAQKPKPQQKIAQPLAAKPQAPKQKQEKPPPAQATPKEPPKTEREEKQEAKSVAPGWEVLVALLANDAKIDKAKAEAVLEAVSSYLAVYPSVGVIRLVEDVARIAKTDQKTVRTALEILRSADAIELREEGVVNLKKLFKKGEIPL
ncbi:MAG: hypothetical protein OWQ51_05225 [Pyrobaculum arsenaticum]|uniref:Uncharacterized protein n=2 Tax=Pyrobaculum arsenaticum TaxID=121277 RepID=A4WJ10_PYRAR|nr:hypothetical protein [Pyrobaculum arsenaticum]ABP50377.1 conserved hypothetical protein [Pyrobaculum arsenaticum DSM 13514]MCY0890365.1 hypothetical protein [Pyrobaculum arsenaticum]NYR14679.1 hypothetical protein [Pyrobaculum arsenaticum]